jgi:hypothetical protein
VLVVVAAGWRCFGIDFGFGFGFGFVVVVAQHTDVLDVKYLFLISNFYFGIR